MTPGGRAGGEASAGAASWRRGARRRRADRVRLAGPASATRVILEPRKLPRQARARVTFQAIVDACGQVLAAGSYEALTTNSISERAGVSIGTLYEYFPNRESIVAALAASSCRRLVARMERAIQETVGMGQFEGVEHLLAAGIEALGSQENAFRAMLREAPFVTTLPAMQEARAALTALCQGIRVQSEGAINLPAPEADTWLISQMLFSAMLEIAFLDGDDAHRTLLRRELARLTCRMALGYDLRPSDAEPALQ
jgi:AcrR family transcriptional regulator